MPNNRRKNTRLRRRLKVHYGERDLANVGFTKDISLHGLFIVGQAIPPLDRRIHLQVFLDNQNTAYFEGTVRRHQQVPPNLRHVEKGGFGVRFLMPEEILERIVRPGDGFELIYDSSKDFHRAFTSELRFGGVFVRTERKLPRDSKVTLSVSLPFAGKVLDLEATVVHCQEGESMRGLGLMFVEPAQALSTFAAFLSP
jgi:hypothetical protein